MLLYTHTHAHIYYTSLKMRERAMILKGNLVDTLVTNVYTLA